MKVTTYGTKITLKGIIDEDFVNYRVPSMVLMFPRCTFKCGRSKCQNILLQYDEDITVSILRLCQRYYSNKITQAVVCQGLEPFDTFGQLLDFIRMFRKAMKDDIVIYTGYDKSEILPQIEQLKSYKNIVIKYGRYIPGDEPHYDEVLGVNLASDNQYAERIS